MTMTDEDITQYATENKEQLVRVLRHSNDSYARAMAWAVLDRGLDDPEFETIRKELNEIERERSGEVPA